MSEARRRDDPPVTITASGAWLESQADPRPWEKVAARIAGMTDPSQTHTQIVGTGAHSA